MFYQPSDRVQELSAQLTRFMDEHIYPVEEQLLHGAQPQGDLYRAPPLFFELQQKAKQAGLWNLFLPDEQHGAGLSNLEYAPLCEIMGRSLAAPQIFNCGAPDTGNMEVLHMFGNEAQQKQWLEPLLDGEIRSAFAMTEPHLASSDATNVGSSIVRDGDEYVINGRKWYITGAMNADCKIIIFMGKTDPDNPARHLQQSQILIPVDTPGVRVVRPMQAVGYTDLPLGHAEMVFENVRVPAENIILGEGRGFEIAQGRLGPGRIHHCMRLIGCAQRALELACKRVEERVAFGKPLSKNQGVREQLAQSWCDIEQARLLTLSAADQMDRLGARGARHAIAAIKIVAPTMAQTVIDRCMQIHGAGGLSQDYFMAEAFAYARTVRLADGPDEVHMMTLGRNLVKEYNEA